MPCQGSCLCGQVRFELHQPGIVINHCHCSRCRKASGAAWGSFLHVPGSALVWLEGEALVQGYQPKEGSARAFCRICGSCMPLLDEDGLAIVPAGSLDDDPGLRPAVHIFCGSRAAWATLPDDGLPRFEASPPDSFWQDLAKG